ncbi:MAG: GNAT family N-acetyltransferase [Oscillospiraceae bacterium]|nr:GNAT family N-acetyltransferase [Oscillospiraceae bacterium]
MEIKEVKLCDSIARELIALSADWEAENISYGYRKNEYSDLDGERIFVRTENGKVIGYLFGRLEKSKNNGAVVPDGADYFEVDEIYVKPAYRSQGVGAALFRYMEEQVRPEAEYLMLGTATKNFRAILHFYIDELGMEFWSAALFKKL